MSDPQRATAAGPPSGVGPVNPGDVITVESPLIGTMTVAVRAHVLGQSVLGQSGRGQS